MTNDRTKMFSYDIEADARDKDVSIFDLDIWVILPLYGFEIAGIKANDDSKNINFLASNWPDKLPKHFKVYEKEAQAPQPKEAKGL